LGLFEPPPQCGSPKKKPEFPKKEKKGKMLKYRTRKTKFQFYFVRFSTLRYAFVLNVGPIQVRLRDHWTKKAKCQKKVVECAPPENLFLCFSGRISQGRERPTPAVYLEHIFSFLFSKFVTIWVCILRLGSKNPAIFGPKKVDGGTNVTYF